MRNVNFAFKMCLAVFTFCLEQCSITPLLLLSVAKSQPCVNASKATATCLQWLQFFLHFARKTCRKRMIGELRADYLTFSHWFSEGWALSLSVLQRNMLIIMARLKMNRLSEKWWFTANFCFCSIGSKLTTCV